MSIPILLIRNKIRLSTWTYQNIIRASDSGPKFKKSWPSKGLDAADLSLDINTLIRVVMTIKPHQSQGGLEYCISS
jgi:hypothetical protein